MQEPTFRDHSDKGPLRKHWKPRQLQLRLEIDSNTKNKLGNLKTLIKNVVNGICNCLKWQKKALQRNRHCFKIRIQHIFFWAGDFPCTKFDFNVFYGKPNWKVLILTKRLISINQLVMHDKYFWKTAFHSAQEVANFMLGERFLFFLLGPLDPSHKDLAIGKYEPV